MKASLVKHCYVLNGTAKFSCLVETPWFGLGFKIHDWGIRLLLVTHHLCIHREDFL